MVTYLQMIETDDGRTKFEEIYEAYSSLMYRVAFKRLNHEQDAQDVVQHVFMKIAENIKNIEPACAKTKRLVMTMVENRATDVLRARSSQTGQEYTENSGVSEAPKIDNTLVECILQLSESQRNIIWLKYYHGYNLREIAELLDISLVWAQKLDQRAKKRLEELYAKKKEECI